MKKYTAVDDLEKTFPFDTGSLGDALIINKAKPMRELAIYNWNIATRRLEG